MGWSFYKKMMEIDRQFVEDINDIIKRFEDYRKRYEAGCNPGRVHTQKDWFELLWTMFEGPEQVRYTVDNYLRIALQEGRADAFIAFAKKYWE